MLAIVREPRASRTAVSLISSLVLVLATMVATTTNVTAAVQNLSITGQTPNPIAAGGTATYTVNLRNSNSGTHMFAVTAVVGTGGAAGHVSVVSSGCIAVDGHVTQNLGTVQIGTDTGIPTGNNTIAITVTEYDSATLCSGGVTDTVSQNVTLAVGLEILMYQASCTAYSQVPANDNWWDLSYDDTGGHTGTQAAPQLNTSIQRGVTNHLTDLPAGCSWTAGTFNLHRGSATGTLIQTVSLPVGGASYTLSVSDTANYARSGSGIWVDEAVPSGYGFGGLRCWDDILYQDNSENVDGVTVGVNQVECIAYNVRQVITFGPLADKTYGDPPITLTATASSNLPVTYSATGSCTVAGNVLTITGNGTCSVTASQAGQASPLWTPAVPVTQTFSIGKHSLLITANSQTKTYGQTVTFAGTEFTTSGLTGADTVTSVTLTSAGAAAGATVAGSPYAITPSAAVGTGLSNYDITYVDGTLTVKQAPSTVTVTCPGSVPYNGSPQTPCSATVTGANGLNESVPVDYLDDHTNIGTAHVSATYAGDANHTGDSDTGSFDITALGVTCTVSGYHVTYDGSSHTATGSCRGPNGEDLSSGLVLSGTRHTAAGTYTDGWTFSYPGYTPQSGTITDQIDKAPLTITANSTSKTYGQTVTFAGTEFTPSGLQNGETIGSATITSTGAGSGAAVGSYAITISDATGGTFNPANYTISYVPGTLTVTARPVLVVTPNDQTRVRGAANPVFTYTITGFVDGDDKSDLSPAPTCTTIADASSPVGTYPITCSGGDTSKYDYDYRPGTLTVTAKPVLHVTANNLSKHKGDPNPTLTYTITGFIDGDDESDLTSPVTCTTTATDSSPAGTYPITCTGAALDKYAITYTPGVLTVVGEEVGGETATPTPPVTSAAPDAPLDNSIPLVAFLICLAFGVLGLLAVQTQRQTMRRR